MEEANAQLIRQKEEAQTETIPDLQKELATAQETVQQLLKGGPRKDAQFQEVIDDLKWRLQQTKKINCDLLGTEYIPSDGDESEDMEDEEDPNDTTGESGRLD